MSLHTELVAVKVVVSGMRGKEVMVKGV